MVQVKLTLGTVSVQSAKPSQAYGSGLQTMPLKSGAAYVLMRANFPTTIPVFATVTSASLVFFQQDGPWTGSVAVSVAKNNGPVSSATTWNTLPSIAAASDSIAKSGAAAGTGWVLDVTADVQAFVSGTYSNYGWRIYTNSATQRSIWAQSSASVGVTPPYLLVTYTVPTKVPSNLSPNGTVISVAKPVLTWTADPDQTAFQVQVDPAANPSPAFDSGALAETTGILDLATTAYAGLSNTATTYWRVRSQGPSGWSNYSAWASMTRTNFGTLTLVNPTTTPADPSPPFSWTYTGATQTAWQADLLDSAGKVVATSGQVGGTDTAWTPSKGLTGSTGTARIRVWDSALRTSTPGVPTYVEASKAITVTLSAGVTPMTTLHAFQDYPSPAVILAGTRATGGIPDEVMVFRNGFPLARFPGTDIFTTSTNYVWTDWSAPVGKEVEYRLAPIVGGVIASGGPTELVTADCQGLWLTQPATGLVAALWGTDGGSWDAADLAAVHVPIAEGSPVVRRRLKQGILSGTLTGEVIDINGAPTAAEVLADLETMAANDAGTVYHLVAGHLNLNVIIGNVTVTPTPSSRVGQVWARVSFDFWSQ